MSDRKINFSVRSQTQDKQCLTSDSKAI